jgi:hypothetical protein
MRLNRLPDSEMAQEMLYVSDCHPADNATAKKALLPGLMELTPAHSHRPTPTRMTDDRERYERRMIANMEQQ